MRFHSLSPCCQWEACALSCFTHHAAIIDAALLKHRGKRQLHSLMTPFDTSLNPYPHEALELTSLLAMRYKQNTLPTFT